jgi:hypothetical protein
MGPDLAELPNRPSLQWRSTDPHAASEFCCTRAASSFHAQPQSKGACNDEGRYCAREGRHQPSCGCSGFIAQRISAAIGNWRGCATAQIVARIHDPLRIFAQHLEDDESRACKDDDRNRGKNKLGFHGEFLSGTRFPPLSERQAAAAPGGRQTTIVHPRMANVCNGSKGVAWGLLCAERRLSFRAKRGSDG